VITSSAIPPEGGAAHGTCLFNLVSTLLTIAIAYPGMRMLRDPGSTDVASLPHVPSEGAVDREHPSGDAVGVRK